MRLEPRDAAERQLRACLGAYPGPPPLAIDAGAPGFWERAKAEGVALLIAQQLQLRQDEALKNLVRGQAVASIRVLSVLRSVLEVLEGAGVVAVPLKGPILAARLYGDYSWRPTSDVDVLIGLDRCDRAIAALEAVGASLDPTYRDHHHRYHRRYGYHIGMIHRGVLVELHFRATSRFAADLPSDPLLRRSRPARVLELPVRLLEPEDELLYLAVHAAAHFFTRDVLLLDLRMLAASAPIDWAEVERRAGRAHVRRAVGAALVMAGHRVGLELGFMDRSWRAPAEAFLRRWPEGVGSDVPATRWESAANLLADAAWSDSPGLALRYAGERLSYSAASLIGRRLAGLIAPA